MSSDSAADLDAIDERQDPVATGAEQQALVEEPVDETNEEEVEEVAYDEEPDEAEAEHEDNAEGEPVTTDSVQDASTAQEASQPVAAAEESVATVRADGSQADEWEISPVPQEWKPAPLFKVKNIPALDEVTEDTVRQVLENAGLSVKSVAFDSVKFQDKRVAYVRLQPPEIPATEESPSKSAEKPETDVSKIAISVVKQLKEADPPLQIGEDKLQFDTSHPQVQLFIGNITEEWSTDASLRAKMEEYGPVERCLVMQSYKGQNKGYAFVEYSVPNGALKCKEGMDKIEAEMRPDFRRKEGLTIQANGRWQQIKLLRAEWAHPRAIPGLYSRVLYITNLTPGFSDTAALKQLFEKFGPVSECHLPRNKQTGNSKGFAFVEFRQSIFADAAYRVVDETDQDFMGSKLVVSFANPAKHYDAHAVRPQNNFNSSLNSAAANKLVGQASPAGNMLAQRASLLAGKAGFGGRTTPGQAAGAFSQQLALPGMGFNEDMAARMQQQTLAMQQQMQLQYQRQMQMTMQQQLRAQQALMQAQLRAAQAQVQQYQEQALQYKTQATQAQLEAQQEAEARKRIEAEARAVAQARMTANPASNYGTSGSEGGYGLNPAAFAAYSNHAGYPGNMGALGQEMYAANAMYSQGFATTSQGWPSGAAMGQTSSNGADGTGFNSGATQGQQAGYSMAHDSFGQAGGYPQQAAFGAFSPQQAAMATPQAAYSMGYGAQAASNSPYGAAFPQTAAAFAQGSTALQSGQKRDSPYDQAGAYGSYGAAGSQAGQEYKRQRY